jgi:hypothetical protein
MVRERESSVRALYLKLASQSATLGQTLGNCSCLHTQLPLGGGHNTGLPQILHIWIDIIHFYTVRSRLCERIIFDDKAITF